MKTLLRDRLLAVPSEKIIDMLFEIADEDEVSWSKIERLVSNPKDNSSRFSRRLKDIKDRGGVDSIT